MAARPDMAGKFLKTFKEAKMLQMDKDEILHRSTALRADFDGMNK